MGHRNLEIIRAELKVAEYDEHTMELKEPDDPFRTWDAGLLMEEQWTPEDDAAQRWYADAMCDHEEKLYALRQRIYDLKQELRMALEDKSRPEKNRKAKERAKKRKAARAGPVPVGMVYAQ